MEKRRMILTTLILSFILSITIAGTAKAPAITTLYVDPPITLNVSAGNSFDVYLTARDAVDLFLTQIEVSFDPSVLQVYDDPLTIDIDGINTGNTAPYMETIWVEKLDNTIGWLQVVSGRPVGVKTGLTGTVQLAKITFEVQTDGFSALYLHHTVAKIVGNVDIEHETEDGFFANAEHVYSCDAAGTQKNMFAEGETVYAQGGFFNSRRYVDVDVVPNNTWTDQQAIGTPILSVTLELVSIKGKHYLPITALGVTPGGFYDIVVDFDQDGVYDHLLDAVDDATSWPGVTQAPVPVSEFPLGAIMPLVLLPVLAYVWWTRKRKNINSNWRR